MIKKIIATVLITALTLTTVGCNKTVSAGKGSYTKGTYTGSAQGFGGEIKVSVTVDEKAIKEVKAEGPQETENIGGEALKELSAKIVEKNSTEVDSISGATYTCEGLISAVNNALALAKGEKPEAKAVSDGKYTVEVLGHEGNMIVTTMFKDEKIASVDVVSHSETQGIGTYATEQIPERIVEAQSLNVDSVTGATISSNTVKQGVSKAIEEAGGDVSKYSVAVEKTAVTEETIEEDVQVAIMGAGTAGLFSAMKLIEAGVKDVILFEKQDIPGGSMPMAYGGVVLSDSEIYNNWGLGNPLYSNWDTMGQVFDKNLTAQGVDYVEGLPFSRRMFMKAGEMYDWMANIGIGFTTLGSRTGYGHPYFAPGCYQGGSGYAMEFLVKRIEAMGGRIIYGTPVTDLVQDETGRITGLVAKGKDGKTWNVKADSVLIASGSFAKNEELIDEYFPEWSGSFFNCAESLTGDGLQLGMKYGAGIEGMGEYIPGFLATYDSHFELAFMHLTTPGIIVNVNGDQFGNIVKDNHKTMSEAKADKANGDTFYYIFDEQAAEMTKDSEAYGFDAYKAIFEKGEAVKYESLEACAKELNLPNLVSTVEKNNKLALAGETDEWGRDNLPYIETREGVWAVRVDPNVYLTTGGLKIDTDARVLKEDGSAIPGLYAAGDVCGSIEQKDGRNYAYGFDAAMTYGAIAAETMIKEMK